ncbi:hypothetical protein P280DRAFT_393047 [Massarina eburnea CBS 473.64]|uniref:Uncharacterized protein n=1 Tax=Massarina eburnea CBS 473.64 TaxID=1395130 RepID=A0A6A6S8C6_9PLEO|nr:hypothetical protein P280DRAFT_393047 [Massarina eburnea CBS 473.64]
MLPQTILLALVAAVSAVPLNINLGAYSPALVVGDGEISLGNTESASQLMSTLASGAAAGNGQGAQKAEQPAAAEKPAEQQGEQKAEGEAAKRGNVRRALDAIFARSAEPVQDDKLAAYEEAMHWIKRDLNGFNAALGYAREAMKNSPKIEMGSEAAGVGMVINAGLSVPANSAANGEKAPKSRRSEVVAEEDAPKMTLVAITEV